MYLNFKVKILGGGGFILSKSLQFKRDCCLRFFLDCIGVYKKKSFIFVYINVGKIFKFKRLDIGFVFVR